MKKKLLVSLLSIFVVSPSSFAADFLVKDATIKEISNTAANLDLFYIVVEGGTGMCADQEIKFRNNSSNSAEAQIFERAFSMALAAFSGNMKINVYDYDSVESCGDAESIRLVR